MKLKRIYQWIWGAGLAYTEFSDGSKLLILPFVIIAWFPIKEEDNE